MKTTRLYTLIYFILFCVAIFFIFLHKEKTADLIGEWVKVKGEISSIKKIKGGIFSIRVGDFYFETDKTEDLKYGERVIIIGKVKEEVINGDYRGLRLINQSITKISSDNKREFFLITPVISTFDQKIKDLRSRILSSSKSVLPEPHSSLFSGIVWGLKEENLDPKFYEELKKAGLVHLVVASGQNLTIFSKVVLDWLAIFLKRKLALVVTLFLILSYVLLIGAEPPLVRASLMVSLTFLGLYMGREVLGGVALTASAMLMLLFDPQLLSSISFQLSFMATFGLVFLSPKIRKFKIFKLPILGQDLLETTSAQIMTSPIIYYHFCILNPLSLLSNLLVLWLIPMLMSLGMVAFFIGLLIPGLARFLILLSWPLLTFFIKVAEIFGR